MTGELGDIVRDICTGSTAFVGVGNTDRRDDGAGVMLVRMLEAAGVATTFDGGTNPERVLPALRNGDFSTVVFCDAVDAGAQPGSVILMNATDISVRYPQVSTHKISLGTLADYLRGEGGPDVYLLGIQPATIDLKPDAALSAPVEKTLKLLVARIGAASLMPQPTAGRQLHAV